MRRVEQLRGWAGNLLVHAGLRLLGIRKENLPEELPSVDALPDDEDDEDIAPAVPVEFSPEAQEMIRKGMPMAPPKPAPMPIPLKGSIQERILQERTRALGIPGRR